MKKRRDFSEEMLKLQSQRPARFAGLRAEQHPDPRVTMLAKETQASRRAALSRRGLCPKRAASRRFMVTAGRFLGQVISLPP